MHFANLVIIKKTKNVMQAVDKAMGPDENDGGFWDWFAIGGRFTGLFKQRDELCRSCGHLNMFHKPVPEFNKEEMLATIQKDLEELQTKPRTFEAVDVQPIEALEREHYYFCSRIITPEKTYGEKRPDLPKIKEKWAGHLVVVVDNHC